jgi:membrane protein implicated in regulation of membrane protease activity
MRLHKKSLTRLVLSTLFCTASVFPAIAVSASERLAQNSGSTSGDATLQTDDSDTVTGRLTAVNGTVARIEQDNGNVEYVNLPTRREAQQALSFVGDRVTISGVDGGTLSFARAPQVVATAPVASTPGSSVSQPETIQPSGNQTTQTQTDTQTTQTQTETQTTQTQPVEADPVENQPTQNQPVQTQPDNTVDTQTQPQSTTQPAETNEPVRGLW